MRVTLNKMISRITLLGGGLICFFLISSLFGGDSHVWLIFFKEGWKPPTSLKRSAFLCVSLFGSLRHHLISNLIPVLIFWMSGDVPMSLKTSCDKVHRINSFGHLNISNNCRWKKFCTSFFSHYLHLFAGFFIHPRWCRISSINRSTFSKINIAFPLPSTIFPMLCHFLLP